VGSFLVSARLWLIFDVRRRVYWRPQQAGYTDNPEEAGRYSDAEALEILERINWTPEGDLLVVALPFNKHWLAWPARGGALRGGAQILLLLLVLFGFAAWVVESP
jgi:hypothetical protein